MTEANIVTGIAETVKAELREHKTWYTIQAVVMIVVGAIAVIYPLVSSTALALVLGWLFLFGGVAQAIGLIGAGKVPNFWLHLVSALLGIVVGLILVMNPAVAVGTLTFMMIVYLIAAGTVKIAFSLSVRPLRNWGWILLAGVLSVVLGVYLMFYPVVAMVTIGLFLGLQLIAEGVALMMLTWE